MGGGKGRNAERGRKSVGRQKGKGGGNDSRKGSQLVEGFNSSATSFHHGPPKTSPLCPFTKHCVPHGLIEVKGVAANVAQVTWFFK